MMKTTNLLKNDEAGTVKFEWWEIVFFTALSEQKILKMFMLMEKRSDE